MQILNLFFFSIILKARLDGAFGYVCIRDQENVSLVSEKHFSFRKAFYFMVRVGNEVEYDWSMADVLCFPSGSGCQHIQITCALN